MTNSTRYRANEPSVIHQVIEGEAVLIHLDNGLYYSLNESGARIWTWLTQGLPRDAVIDALVAATAAPRADATSAVDDMIERLRTESLLVPATDAATNGAAPEPFPSDELPLSAQIEPAPFIPPRLDRYDDLQELLLLDPIHAVDESGWPDRRPDS